MKKPWKQELVWVRRDENGVIVRIEAELPVGAEFEPTIWVKQENEKATVQGSSSGAKQI